MLESIAARRRDLPTWYVHGALNGRVHAMRERVRSLSARSEAIKSVVFYAEPSPEDERERHFDERGMISPDWLARNTPLGEAVYYLCGPKAFLRALVGGLLKIGVPRERVRYEFFGPADEIFA